MMLRRFLVCAVFTLAALPASAQDERMGALVAQRWCAGCHNIEPGAARRGNDAVPSFAAIARMPSTTAASLAGFLSLPHASMPDYSLSRADIANVSAYIVSLKRD